MKFFFSTIFLLFFAFSSHGQENSASRYANEIKNVALYTLISTRCHRYLPEAKVNDCQRTVTSMLDIIDSGMIFPSDSKGFLFIAFKNNLIHHLSQELTSVYLKDLNEKLNLALQQDEPTYNLWSVTLKHFPDPLMASAVVAALFQDTSPGRLHLAYLQRNPTPQTETFKSNQQLLAQTIDTIQLILDYRPETFHALLLPPEVTQKLKRNIYHFYVPFYLSQKLHHIGVSKDMSYVAPIMMTLTYEFITTSSDYRYLFKDPQNLDSIHSEGKIKDILACHLGAGMGVKRKNLKDLDFLKESFNTSTELAVKAMISR